jgi:hypothetical protein
MIRNNGVFYIEPAKSRIIRLREVVNSTDLSNNADLDLDDWAYIFEYDQYSLLLSCKAIYRHFYAPSTIFDNLVQSGNMSSIYKKVQITKNGIVKIDFATRKILKDHIIIHLGKILSNQLYCQGFYYHFFQKAIKKYKNIKSILPIKDYLKNEGNT